MAELEPGAKVAKDLGIYLGQIYGWVKAGKVKNHKKDGKYVVEGGKGLLVDPAEVREAWMNSKKKGPRTPRAKREKVVNEAGVLVDAPKTRKLKVGEVVSFENGKELNSTRITGPRVTVAQVIGRNDRLTFMDDGDHRRSYDGTVIDHMFFGTERLGVLLSKGVAHIERPASLLGFALFQFIVDGKIELAQSLEDWLEANGLEVQVPEVMDIEEDDEPEPIRGKVVALSEEVDDD